MQHGTEFQFLTMKKYNTVYCCTAPFYLTAEVSDPGSGGSTRTFQTLAVVPLAKHNRVEIIVCRFKPFPQEPYRDDRAVLGVDESAVDPFYKGDLPVWPWDHALAPEDEHQFCEVKESEWSSNQWLYLYMELAAEWKLGKHSRMEMKKVVLQTKEEVETSMKVKAKNAIFFMNFTIDNVAYRGIARRSVDGIPGHLTVDGRCWIEQ